MAYATLPMPKKNSVKTTLSSGITASDTTIPVADLSKFYDKDGALILKGIVIGFLNSSDIIPEEITITGASGTSGAGNLTGATRGVNADGSIGAAAIWPTGTEIAVMLSTAISLQIRDNFEALNTGKLAANGAANGKLYIGKADGTFALVNLTQGANVTITNSDGGITIAAASGGVTFAGVSGTTQQAAVNNGYIPLNAALTTITLPATAAVGDVVAISGHGAGKWKLAQNASQLIHFLSLTSTTGTGGYISATSQYDCIIVRCVEANTTWVVENAVGNLDVI